MNQSEVIKLAVENGIELHDGIVDSRCALNKLTAFANAIQAQKAEPVIGELYCKQYDEENWHVLFNHPHYKDGIVIQMFLKSEAEAREFIESCKGPKQEVVGYRSKKRTPFGVDAWYIDFAVHPDASEYYELVRGKHVIATNPKEEA